jgi:hypothetical protein
VVNPCWLLALVDALRTCAEDLNGVADPYEPVIPRDAVSPTLDFGTLYFDRPSTAAAHEVVVVIPRRATTIERFAVVRTQDVDLTAVGESSKLVVDSGESDVLSTGSKFRKEFLGRPEGVRALENGRECSLLPSRALLGDAGFVDLFGHQGVHH